MMLPQPKLIKPQKLSNDLTGEVIIITGATGSLGQVVAKAIGLQGAKLILVARSFKKLSKLKGTLNKLHISSLIAPIDYEVCDDETLKNLIQNALERYGLITGVVHLSGQLGLPTPLEYYPESYWQMIMRINFDVPRRLNQHLLPILKENCSRIIMNWADFGSASPAYWGAFGMAQISIQYHIHTLNQEYAKSPLQSYALCPGKVLSNLHRQAFPGQEHTNWSSPDAIVDVYSMLLSKTDISENECILSIDGDIKTI